jgi:hypothetical protein
VRTYLFPAWAQSETISGGSRCPLSYHHAVLHASSARQVSRTTAHDPISSIPGAGSAVVARHFRRMLYRSEKRLRGAFETDRAGNGPQLRHLTNLFEIAVIGAGSASNAAIDLGYNTDFSGVNAVVAFLDNQHIPLLPLLP